MKLKWIFRIFLVMFVVIAVSATALLVFMDHIVRSAVEHGGTYALGVATTLDRMDIGLVSGSANASGLTVSNPDGFDTPHFFRLDAGRVAVTVRSLMQDKLIVPEVTLTGVSMNLEKKGDQANYMVILDHLKKFESEEEPADSTEDRPETQETQQTQFVIEKLAIRDIDVQVDLMQIGDKPLHLPVKIDLIEMENIGSDTSGGSLITELTSVVIKSILTAVTQEAGDLIPADFVAELDEGLEQLKDLGGATVQISDDLKKQADQVEQEIRQTGKKLGEQLDDVGKTISQGLGDLLKRDKQKDGESR